MFYNKSRKCFRIMNFTRVSTTYKRSFSVLQWNFHQSSNFLSSFFSNISMAVFNDFSVACHPLLLFLFRFFFIFRFCVYYVRTFLIEAEHFCYLISILCRLDISDRSLLFFNGNDKRKYNVDGKKIMAEEKEKWPKKNVVCVCMLYQVKAYRYNSYTHGT